MSSNSLIIVESPTKARTIVKFLGKGFVVKASNGHIRDLPNNASEIPPTLKKEPWARLGINVDANFEAIYVVPKSKKQNVKDLKDALKNAQVVFLATDEDREGESISWHLVQTLKPKVPIKRLVFHEITKEAIQQALNSPRDIDENLVRAQETRRIIDRLFGYEVSPLLWKKIASKLSAGRVQSVTIRLLVERENERMKFRMASFWGIKAEFAKPSTGETFQAQLTHIKDKRVATGKDFDPNTGQLLKADSIIALDINAARELVESIKTASAVISSVEEKPYTTKPQPPFVTSTLQQEANRKFRLSAKATMGIAQRLYENGFITYMRTDSTTLSEEALGASRALIKEHYGNDYLPPAPRVYKTQVKNAQEAHEAIRPAGANFASQDQVGKELGEEAAKLYDLIWKRTVASQMTDAYGKHIGVSIECNGLTFRASGKTIEFPGFLRAYVEGSDDPDAKLADQEKLLPVLNKGEHLDKRKIDSTEHHTQPPARYTEGTIIKELERRGIGRPSTWASIVDVILSRSYAVRRQTALVPTFTAMAVVNLLEKHFTHLLDYEFTARLEDDLDAISRGEAENIRYLSDFYFGNSHFGLKTLVEQGEKSIDPRDVCGIPISSNDGTPSANLEVRIGRWGPFLTDGTRRAGLPEDIAPDELTPDKAAEILAQSVQEAESLGNDPQTNEPVFLKNGRFGPYVQLGEQIKGGPKPKMASLLAGMKPEEITLDTALKLLSLPRTLGENPGTKEPILAASGRYGPYIKCGTETRSIPTDLATPIDITYDQALELLSQPKKGRSSRGAKVLRELGENPLTKAPIVLKSGIYGPYVTDGTTNASLAKSMNVDELTLEQALELIEARVSNEGETKGKPKKAATTRKKTKSDKDK